MNDLKKVYIANDLTLIVEMLRQRKSTVLYLLTASGQRHVVAYIRSKSVALLLIQLLDLIYESWPNKGKNRYEYEDETDYENSPDYKEPEPMTYPDRARAALDKARRLEAKIRRMEGTNHG